MPAPAPPHLVRTMMARGCSGNFEGPAPAFNPEESVALVRYLARLLGDRSAATGDALVDLLATILGSSTQRHRVAQPLACAKGCGSCCHQKVSVNAVEIFTVARRLRKSREVAVHLGRLAARPVRDPGRTLDAAKPCAFLADNACSIHAVRPAVCRIIVSLDVRACLRRLDAGDGLLPWPRSHEAIRTWLNTALWTAHVATGLDPRTYDFEGGVAAVLADPGIEARWYAGDDGLAAVADRPLPAGAMPAIAQLRSLAKL